MNEYILGIPRHHVRDVIKTIRVGLDNAEVDDSIREQLEIWCDNMEEELDEDESNSLD